MKIIVLNCGSSSIKYQLFEMTNSKLLAKGVAEKIGLHGSFIKHERTDGINVTLQGEIVDHQAGIEYILGILKSQKYGSIKNFKELDAVGHRVVHGGESFKSSALITDIVVEKMKECIDLAPLHNPPNLKGIEAMQLLLPHVHQVAVFDTAFHQTMPQESYMYAIPYSLYRKYGLRRYGFHGMSHKYVSTRAADIINKDIRDLKIITCHLGNGASITAIKGGKSVDTSMGLTPVEGLIMGTRTGDLDLGVLLYIMQKEGIDHMNANTLINKHSGMLGITGISSDMREIESAAVDKNERAILGLKMYNYRIKKYIGAYTAAMGGLDIVVFTGGVGENDPSTRENVCQDLSFLGIELDIEKNAGAQGKEIIITKPSSKVAVIVVPTNEELVIALDTQRIVEKLKSQIK
jgi:acetate kinase